MVPTGCSETSVRNYHFTLRKVSKKRRSHSHRGGSLKSRNSGSTYKSGNEFSRTVKTGYFLSFLSFLRTITRLKSAPLDRSNGRNFQNLPFNEDRKKCTSNCSVCRRTFLILTDNHGIITVETKDKNIIFIPCVKEVKCINPDYPANVYTNTYSCLINRPI